MSTRRPAIRNAYIKPINSREFRGKTWAASQDVRNGALDQTATRPAEPTWQSLRPSPQQLRAASECRYCHRMGHTIANCRKLLNQCLACGSTDHFIASCPERSVDLRSKSETRNSRGLPRPRVTFDERDNYSEGEARRVLQPSVNYSTLE